MIIVLAYMYVHGIKIQVFETFFNIIRANIGEMMIVSVKISEFCMCYKVLNTRVHTKAE